MRYFILLLIAVLLLPWPAAASHLAQMKVAISTDINQDCNQPPGFDPVWGCYVTEKKQVFISISVPPALLPSVFLHEVAHFLLDGSDGGEMQVTFNPTPARFENSGRRIDEVVADEFVLWVLGGKVSPPQERFFAKLLAR